MCRPVLFAAASSEELHEASLGELYGASVRSVRKGRRVFD